MGMCVGGVDGVEIALRARIPFRSRDGAKRCAGRRCVPGNCCDQFGGSVMHSSAKIFPFPNSPRPANRWDRAATRARVASAYAHGDARRRDETARQLEALAREFRNGEHGELILSMAARLLELRPGGRRKSNPRWRAHHLIRPTTGGTRAAERTDRHAACARRPPTICALNNRTERHGTQSTGRVAPRRTFSAVPPKRSCLMPRSRP